jgi:hypothetical protein
MICRSDGAYRNFFRGNYKDLAPTERASALKMSKLYGPWQATLLRPSACRPFADSSAGSQEGSL